MKRPTEAQLLDFFHSEVFTTVPVSYDLAIKEFYKRFDPRLDQGSYNEIGIHVNSIVREPYIIEEGEAHENKTIVFFHFLKNTDQELSFTLWGEMEEESFFTLPKEGLLDFFEIRFRRFGKLLNRGSE